MKISSMCFKRNLCSKASSRKPKMALSGKILGRSGAVPKNSWSCLHKMEIFLDLWLHLSFIFSFAGRTQWWFNFPKFKEHFFFTKRILLSILYWKTLNFVSTVTKRGERYIDFQSKSNLLKYHSQYNCKVGFSDICIWYNSLLPNLFKQYKLFF